MKASLDFPTRKVESRDRRTFAKPPRTAGPISDPWATPTGKALLQQRVNAAAAQRAEQDFLEAEGRELERELAQTKADYFELLRKINSVRIHSPVDDYYEARGIERRGAT